MIADVASDAVRVGTPVGGGLILLSMLKMMWTDRTRGAIENAALRKQFTDERVARELEFTAEKATQQTDYQQSLIRHQQIHAQEIAAFQSRITGYIEELNHTKGRVTILEAEVKELKVEARELRAR